MYVLNDGVIIANALYAKETDSLNYEEIDNYKKLLYKLITEKHKYIMFKSSESKIIELENHTFIKRQDGVLCMEPLDEEYIELVNSIYPEDIRASIRTSHNKVKKLKKQS